MFAHDAVVAMDGDSDPAAPGGAITVARCDSWDHDPPCPLAPHLISGAPAEVRPAEADHARRLAANPAR